MWYVMHGEFMGECEMGSTPKQEWNDDDVNVS